MRAIRDSEIKGHGIENRTIHTSEIKGSKVSGSKLKESEKQGDADRFLVCGMGSLGQYCVNELSAFGVRVSAIESSPKAYWEFDDLEEMLEQLHIGDCRNNATLLQADVTRCRAALLVTSSDRVNIDTAMAVRLLSPTIRIVMRCNKEGLNNLLSEQLGNFVAFEPSKLSAPAFALAAMGDALMACFPLEGEYVQVVRRSSAIHPELTGHPLSFFNTRLSSVIVHEVGRGEGDQNKEDPGAFQDLFQWDPDDKVGENDGVITLEITRNPGRIASRFLLEENRMSRILSDRDRREMGGTQPDNETMKEGVDIRGKAGTGFIAERRHPIKRFRADLYSRCRKFFTVTIQWTVNWIWVDHVRRVALFSSGVILLLLFTGAVLFRFFAPEISTQDAVYDAVVLLLGGYSDLLGSELSFSLEIPWWLRLMGLLLTMSGTVFMGLIYAVITQYLLSTRFRFGRATPLPSKDHVILFGLRRIGKEVTGQLNSFGIPLIGIPFDDENEEKIPTISQNNEGFETCLNNANLQTASSLVSLSRDELANLEIGLLARSIRPDIRLVIRTYDARFSHHLARIWPEAQVLSASSLAAEAFAASAFGEKVPTLFRIGGKTVLVTEYCVEQGDSLNGKVLVTFSCGYGVQPLMIMKSGCRTPIWLPPNDTALEIGDRLVVLATIQGIQRVEKGALFPAEYSLYIEKPSKGHGLFDGANILSRMTGVGIGACRDFMENGLPGRFPVPLYLHQGKRLTRQLRRNMLRATLEKREMPFF